MEEDLRKTFRKQAVEALNVASGAPKPTYTTLFSDVYDELPWNLREQQEALVEHMDKYPQHYESVRRA